MRRRLSPPRAEATAYAAVTFAVLASPLTAHATDPGPGRAESSARAIRIERAPVLDGRDDDMVWQTAPLIDGFRQFAPAEDAPTAFRTTVRVAYDDRYLVMQTSGARGCSDLARGPLVPATRLCITVTIEYGFAHTERNQS